MSILHVFERKVPPDITPSSGGPTLNPHAQLALSLVNLLKEPLVFLNRLLRFCQTQAATALADNEKVVFGETFDLLVDRFCKELMTRKLTHQIYNFILPMLSRQPAFPHEQIILYLECRSQVGERQETLRSLSLLSALVVLLKPAFGELKERAVARSVSFALNVHPRYCKFATVLKRERESCAHECHFCMNNASKLDVCASITGSVT